MEGSSSEEIAAAQSTPQVSAPSTAHDQAHVDTMDLHAVLIAIQAQLSTLGPLQAQINALALDVNRLKGSPHRSPHRSHTPSPTVSDSGSPGLRRRSHHGYPSSAGQAQHSPSAVASAAAAQTTPSIAAVLPDTTDTVLSAPSSVEVPSASQQTATSSASPLRLPTRRAIRTARCSAQLATRDDVVSSLLDLSILQARQERLTRHINVLRRLLALLSDPDRTLPIIPIRLGTSTRLYRALWDSGSQGDFVYPRVVEEARLATSGFRSPISVTLGENKTQHFFDQTVRDLHFSLTLQPSDSTQTPRPYNSFAYFFEVLETGYDFILGTPWSRWFRSTEAEWATETLVLKTKCGQTHRIPFIGTTGDTPLDLPPQDPRPSGSHPDIAFTSPRQFAHFIRQEDVTFYSVNVMDLLRYDPLCPEVELISLEPDPPDPSSIFVTPIFTSTRQPADTPSTSQASAPSTVESRHTSRADADTEELTRFTADLEPAVRDLIREYRDVFPPYFSYNRIPPMRGVEHSIQLVPDYRVHHQAPYRLSIPEATKLKCQLEELLRLGFIKPSNRFFTKIDLRSGYHQIHVATEDQPKTAFRSCFGHYEFTVMSFGLTNAPATFQTAMNDIFRDILEEYVLVYLDDILVYSRTLEDHLRHLRDVLQRLRKHGFYAKLSKCRFAQRRVDFLGHHVSDQSLHMDDAKITAIAEWPVPTSAKQLRSFLGLTSYYSNFIQGDARYSYVLTSTLLRKNPPWFWTPLCEDAFRALKKMVTCAPVLRLPDFDRPFIVTTDASDFAVGVVLSQVFPSPPDSPSPHAPPFPPLPADTASRLTPTLPPLPSTDSLPVTYSPTIVEDGTVKARAGDCPIAFYSRQLLPAEINYTADEREVIAVVYATRHWRHYLQGAPFTVRTDNSVVQAFLTKPKLSPRQARWWRDLSEFSFTTQPIMGETNRVVDALSRRPDHNQEPIHLAVIFIATVDQSVIDAHSCPALDDWIAHMAAIMKRAHESLADSQTRMAARANRSRMDHPFKVGDDVLVDACHLQLEADTLPKFRRRFFGPCRILQAVGFGTAASPVSFRVKLPDYLRQARVHDVYHISLLRPYRRSPEHFVGHPYERPPLIMVDGHEEFVVSDIVSRRVTDDTPPRIEYLVRWKGYPDEEATWEPLKHLQHTRMLVRAYDRARRAETSASTQPTDPLPPPPAEEIAEDEPAPSEAVPQPQTVASERP
ncbi:hypothetical protein CBR_g52027 [Chara braunii]|uniref:RNA-directed DNA polymerase n=1 Tax=Chara braunii TaxID=69332 RepID=A0A388M9B9_CHABU|nr:hypothetical protein CBR_g52027 [Chara braunii]|eukprot:GBG91146.1 hypothetical protein CBR_g52027 [Chara braunii]